MMETAVYTYQFLYAKEMLQHGELGRIQLLKGAHYQNMDNWPSYREGLPPMHYVTLASVCSFFYWFAVYSRFNQINYYYRYEINAK